MLAQSLSLAHFPLSIATMPLRNAEGPSQVQISGAHLLVRKAWWFGQPGFNLSDENNAETVSNVRLNPRGAAVWSARLRFWLRSKIEGKKEAERSIWEMLAKVQIRRVTGC
jgi:hypothetical protein